MSPIPTGRLFKTDEGGDLVLTRTFRAPAEDVWASITEPERTARWFGPWEGDAAPGRTIKVRMLFEEQTPWYDMRIDACDPPRRLAISSLDEHGVWHIEMLLTEADGTTELRFVQHLDSVDGIGDIGPGWEYYLDMLVSSRDGSAQPDFNDYYPSMRAYFQKLTQ
ncbi:Activator of Hsp90 ATPase homolog 1-like protein [Nonomuraea solani]|uniref:Activator of Hsp90 ATPase homolog 1-like protein n=1 Tax=Nonomuraea solani TaxID=1144553 RepID=A0A1H6DJ95_9ACTN|nr:SRPBCC family protein [Nonomuraea solani]SEG85340.1 Activator of Hsp90 ATPase homolog 1-like protein [Nonomuraea solani]